VGGGVYMPEPATLLQIRQHIAAHHAEFRKILKAKAVRELLGEVQASNSPGCRRASAPPIRPRSAALQELHSLYGTAGGDCRTPELFAEILRRFKAMKPFLDFLTRRNESAARLPDVW